MRAEEQPKPKLDAPRLSDPDRLSSIVLIR
jgi:hypothetical protein